MNSRWVRVVASNLTSAFLALFPRVHVTILVWAIFAFWFQVPAMILIVFKIILWDNIVAPSFNQAAASNVAYSAHLGGYAFGFAIATALLAFRVLPPRRPGTSAAGSAPVQFGVDAAHRGEAMFFDPCLEPRRILEYGCDLLRIDQKT